MLYRISHSASTVTITGRNLAHGRRSAVERAFALVGPTLEQSAALVRICRQYVRAATAITAENAELRQAVLAGRVPLLEAAAKRESLAERLARSSRDELLEAGRAIGPAVVWDCMVEPLL